jgi:hypothetical protein
LQAKADKQTLWSRFKSNTGLDSVFGGNLTKEEEEEQKQLTWKQDQDKFKAASAKKIDNLRNQGKSEEEITAIMAKENGANAKQYGYDLNELQKKNFVKPKEAAPPADSKAASESSVVPSVGDLGTPIPAGNNVAATTADVGDLGYKPVTANNFDNATIAHNNDLGATPANIRPSVAEQQSYAYNNNQQQQVANSPEFKEMIALLKNINESIKNNKIADNSTNVYSLTGA